MIGKEKSTQDPGSKNRNPGHPPHYCGLAQQLRPGFRSIPGPPACDRLKILLWDRDGFVLWYKRLEEGVFKLPRAKDGERSLELRASELAMVLDGIDVSKLKRVARYQRAV